MDKLNQILCPYCHNEFSKQYNKSCGNCFACLGCEIYDCPHCHKEVVIKPMPKFETDN